MKNEIHFSLRTGRAGELQVLSQLILRGHVPYVPAIDTGTDIMLDNGVRIQVRSTRLQNYNQTYHRGAVKAYHFCLRSQRWVNNTHRKMVLRDWSKHCDFFVLWCVDENRFFIVPQVATGKRADINIKQRGDLIKIVDVAAASEMHSKGATYSDIARHFGVSHPTARRAVTRGISRATDFTRTILQFEDRWDLLDTNSVVEKLVESSVVEEKI